MMATRIDFSKYVLNGLKIKNLTQDILLGPAFNLLKGTCSSSIELEYNFQEGFNALTNKLDWNNPERDRCPFDLSKPLPLQGPPGHRTVTADYFFNNDLEYLKTSDLECARNCTDKVTRRDYGERHWKILLLLSLILKRRVEDLQLGVESYQKKLNITKPQKTFLEIEFKEPYTPSYDPPGIVYEDLNKQKRVLQADELYKFSNGTLKSVPDEIHHRVLEFRLDYNTQMTKRK
ncbi:hypothetical protein Tco_0257189 [Tanacetum coccineum]